MFISKNIEGFEDRILIPVYQKLIFNVNKRKGVYFFTFNRYRKLICKLLQNSKILKKVKPYGSLMNNFMIDSGDIDICIVPNCGILEFATYLDKIKEALISQVFLTILIYLNKII
jgi:DNA polymerase sigma